jgi:hypothetical protein
MRKIFAGVSLLLLLTSTGRSGPSDTFDKTTTVSGEAPSWYAAREFNIQFWGTYAFTANDYRQNQASKDRYLEADHAWGGGLGAKYFFNRYLAVGVEGYAVSRTASFPYVSFFAPVGTTQLTLRDTRTIGAGLATLTLRCPLGASRFAPYAFAGGGFIAGGGQNLRFEVLDPRTTPPGTNPFRAYADGSQTEAIGQFGAGLEIRLTRRIGVTNDLSWNVVDGRDNNFGMARSGINLVF